MEQCYTKYFVTLHCFKIPFQCLADGCPLIFLTIFIVLFQLGHPKGLRFQTQKGKREPHFHSYITTREDGSRSYGAVLTFYESMDAPQIISAMQTLQNMHMAELSNAQSRTLYSRLEEYGQSPKRSHKPNVKTIGRIYDCRRDTLYVTKAISVISSTPLIATFEKVLHAILDTIRRDEPLELPLESYIYNLIYEVPLPPPGRSMKLFTANQVLVCQRPSKYSILNILLLYY